MASEGPLSPATAANDASIGSNAWSNPSNALTENGTNASCVCTTASPNSNYLKVTDFGFAIPSGATIDGIIVEVKKAYVLDIPRDNAVRIVKGGAIGATDKSIATDWTSTSLTWYTYGTSSELWGETWTDSDINASDFGFVISAKRQSGGAGFSSPVVDHIRITVYYTEGGGGSTAAPIFRRRTRRFAQSF